MFAGKPLVDYKTHHKMTDLFGEVRLLELTRNVTK